MGILITIAIFLFSPTKDYFNKKFTEIQTFIVTLSDENPPIPRDQTMRKTFQQRQRELEDGISLLKEDLESYKSGDKKQIKPISAQLRALICFGSRSLNPLLINLAEEKGINLECYGPPSLDEELSLLKNPVLIVTPGRLIATEWKPGLTKYTFKEWLDTPIFFLSKELGTYTPNEVIRAAAEKLGGVHYDEEIPLKIKNLQGMVWHTKNGTVKYDEIERLLIQTAEIVVYFGNKVLENRN